MRWECAWEITPEGTPKPQLQKANHQAQRGSLPVHLRNEGKSGEERSSVGGTQRDKGSSKFFLLKTFPKKCVFSIYVWATCGCRLALSTVGRGKRAARDLPKASHVWPKI